MKRKITEMAALLLCSFLFLAVADISALANQPSLPTSQETVSDGLEAEKLPRNMMEPQQSAADAMETEPGAEGQMETEPEETEPETEEGPSANTEPESEMPVPETKQSETAATEPEDSITLIETESAIDADGNVTMTVETADTLVLPVTMTMKGSDGLFSMTVSRNGQQIKIKPDTYDITKAVDGNGKKLPSGAGLSIPKEGGVIYLDFTKPGSGENTLIAFLRTNCLFLMVALVLALVYRKYVHS